MSADAASGAATLSYEEIMGLGQNVDSNGGSEALSSRLRSFRRWLADDAKCSVHANVCIVNGEATDGTKNAPVLLFGPPPSAQSPGAPSGSIGAGEGRCGVIDEDRDRALYDRTMGCQVRVAKELKKDEVMMTVPRSSMVTPDLVAASDAGRSVLACCKASTTPLTNFWDAFENTAAEEKRFAEKVSSNSGTQVLVKILQERKKAEKILAEAERSIAEGKSKPCKLAERGSISTRAPVLAFLLQQRFLNELRPAVVSFRGNAEERGALQNGGGDEIAAAAETVSRIDLPPGAPDTFGPYARTLPSYVSLPICWKRNELALLAGCIPGLAPLQEVAARTMQLSSDLIALVNGGILHRFPHVFPRGLITWDRWVWAASCFTSRALPASCYLNRGEESARDHISREGEPFYSPPEVWDELGVLVPLLDMLNHESEAAQVTWISPSPPSKEADAKVDDPADENAGALISEDQNDDAKVTIHKKVKKGCQIYTNYGIQNNQNLILQYGFAQINNPSDEVRIGWGLMDAVGGITDPHDYKVCCDDLKEGDNQYLVFESGDPVSINRWWTESRLVLLEEEARVDSSLMSNLKAGRKLNVVAYSEGVYDPIFLSAAVVATMSPQGVRNRLSVIRLDREEGRKTRLTISKRHQRILREYIVFLFSRKLEKLLQNLSNGLKDHFNNVQLWTKASSGGLAYNAAGSAEGVEENGSSTSIGWQNFFDSYAYAASMEVEKRYYAMGSDSCVLSLYDGSLRSLQASIDGALCLKDYEDGTLKQLIDLGYELSEDDIDEGDNGVMDDAMDERHAEKNEDQVAPIVPQDAKPLPGDVTEKETNETLQQEKEGSEELSASDAKAEALDRNRNRRVRKKSDRPPATKLHIGNLSYQTTPSALFDFFAGIYGKENVLECHIPTERDSGRSRGFGFVTMPEEAATQALQSGRAHEIDGRLLKLAESNTAGSGRKIQPSSAGGSLSSDRCSTCGYRPKYCTCSVPNLPGYGNYGGVGMMVGPGPCPPDDMYGPSHVAVMGHHDFGPQYGRHNPEYDSHGSGRHRSRSLNDRGRSPSRSPSPWSGGGRGGYHRENRYYGRGRREYRGRSYSRSRSRSYSRSRDRDRDRDRRDRGRGGDRDRESRGSCRHGGSSRNSGAGRASRSSRASRYSRSRSPSRSGSYGKGSPSRRGSDRERRSNCTGDSAERHRGRSSRSRSISPPQFHSRASAGGNGGSDKKREGRIRNRSRSRSRSRERSGRRKRSSKERHRKESSKRHSRSRS